MIKSKILMDLKTKKIKFVQTKKWTTKEQMPSFHVI
jgi:hypothetical protein